MEKTISIPEILENKKNYLKKRDQEKIFKKLVKQALKYLKKEDEDEKNVIYTEIVKENRNLVERKVVGYLTLDPELLKMHTFIVGASGYGKSTLIKRIMKYFLNKQYILEQEKSPYRKLLKMIVHDTKGDMIKEFYNEKDWIILNPFDERGYGFNIFETLEINTDIEKLCRALSPESEKGEPIWSNSTVDILTGIINLCMFRSEFTNQDILKYINMDYETLAKNFRTVEIKDGKMITDDKGKPVMKTIEGCSSAYTHLSSSQAGNLYSNFNSNMSFFKNLVSCKRELNIRKYLEEDTRNLILPNFDKLQASLSPIHSMFIEQITSIILDPNLPSHPERNIVFLLDEFASFKKIDAVLRLLRLMRSAGASMFIGIQEFAPLEVKYGKEVATFKQNTTTKIFLSTKDDETQKQVVSMIGEEEREITERSRSAGIEENKDGMSSSTKRVRQNAIMGSYLTGFKRGEFLIMHDLSNTKENKNFVGRFEGGIIDEIDKNPEIAEAFVVREELKLTKLINHFKKIEENLKRKAEGLEELKEEDTEKNNEELEIIQGEKDIEKEEKREQKKQLLKEQLLKKIEEDKRKAEEKDEDDISSLFEPYNNDDDEEDSLSRSFQEQLGSDNPYN